MSPCYFCGQDTELHFNERPVCVTCMNLIEAGEKPRSRDRPRLGGSIMERVICPECERLMNEYRRANESLLAARKALDAAVPLSPEYQDALSAAEDTLNRSKLANAALSAHIQAHIEELSASEAMLPNS